MELLAYNDVTALFNRAALEINKSSNKYIPQEKHVSIKLEF